MAIDHQAEVIRHAGTVMVACVWMFFLFDRLATYFFTKKMIDTNLENFDRSHAKQAAPHTLDLGNTQRPKMTRGTKRTTLIRNSMLHQQFGDKRATQIENYIDQTEWVTGGGHLRPTLVRPAQETNRNRSIRYRAGDRRKTTSFSKYNL